MSALREVHLLWPIGQGYGAQHWAGIQNALAFLQSSLVPCSKECSLKCCLWNIIGVQLLTAHGQER